MTPEETYAYHITESHNMPYDQALRILVPDWLQSYTTYAFGLQMLGNQTKHG